MGAGITEAILVNPFEVVKVTLQANRATGKEVPSTWTVTRQIVRENGLGFRGLNKGVTATIARNGVFNMVYFGFYHSVKGLLPEYDVSTSPVKFSFYPQGGIVRCTSMSVTGYRDSVIILLLNR